MDLSGASAVVTGGASGLGLATVRRLRKRGAEVVILDIESSPGEAVAGETGAHFVSGDVRDEASAEAAVARARAIAPLRVVVNCAGVGVAGRTVGRNGKMPLENFTRVLDINLVGTFNVLSTAAAAMADNELVDGERGVVINTASAAAYDGQQGQVPYAASKAAIAGMTLPLARDLAVIGVRVMTIAPGMFDTPLMRTLPEPALQKLQDATPYPKRLGNAEEYASLVESIVDNPYLNGETIRLDGATRLGYPG